MIRGKSKPKIKEKNISDNYVIAANFFCNPTTQVVYVHRMELLMQKFKMKQQFECGME